MENLTPTSQLQQYIAEHREHCITCSQLNQKESRCNLSRCPGPPWQRPRCPVFKFNHTDEFQLLATRLQPQRINPVK